MATIPLNWDNTAVAASGNTISQRAYKRIKAVGGSWDTIGFAPANDLAISDSFTLATILSNNVYEFKIEALCVIGGPTANGNGVREGIVFACIAPSFTPGENNVEVSIDVSIGSIQKARIVLKKQSDNSTVDDQTVNRVGGFITYDFTGLAFPEAYYVEIELYDTVNGVEVVSSDAAYLGVICGGNTAGYQVETVVTPNVEISNTSVDVELTDLQVNGNTVTGGIGLFPVLTGEDKDAYTPENTAGSTVTVVFTRTDITQHISCTDTTGFFQCHDTGSPFTFTGVDMSGPGNLIIEIGDGVCP